MAPFDHPEIFVPLDGAAPDNTFARSGFLNIDDSAATGNGLVPVAPMFKHVAAVGAAGRADPLANFLGISSEPTGDCVSQPSHFCR